MLLFYSPACCTESSSLALNSPDIIKLIAYAIIGTTKPTKYSHKELLTSLKNFSRANKKIHETLHNLRCGPENTTENFNNYLIAHLAKSFDGKYNPECLAAAYVGTPYALQQVCKTYSFSITTNEFKVSLGARYRCSYKTYMVVDHEKYIADSRTVYYKQEEYCELTLPTAEETLSKFPPSTRTFCNQLLLNKEYYPTIRLLSQRITA